MSVHPAVLSRRPGGVLARELVFSVLDVETTGFDPSADRVVEVAVVTMTGAGAVLGEFSSLVSGPVWSVDAERVHGIRPAELVDAPRWSQVWPAVADRLRGTVLAAHNLQFDAAFLAHEVERCNGVVPDVSGVCTLETVRRHTDAVAGRLGVLHRLVTGREHTAAHRALGDARAAARVLAWLLGSAPEPLRLQAGTAGVSRGRRCADPGGGVDVVRWLPIERG